MERYVFEIQTTSARAKIWIAEAGKNLAKDKSKSHFGEVKNARRDDRNIEVRIFESHK